MEALPRKLETYISPNGSIPFETWVKQLRDNKAQAKIQLRLDRVRLGNFGDCQSVGEGVYELRIHYGPGYRVYFGQVGVTLVLLLCGGDKSTQVNDIR